MPRPLGPLFRASFVVALLLLAGRAAAQTELPVNELDPLFQGGREGHAYTLAMLELGMRMGAATTAALRDDRDRAIGAVKSFREQYAVVAKMVPAWKNHFRDQPISELENAVSQKADVAARRAIVTRIENSCTACHAKYMFPVQARYRWGSFANASLPGDQGGLRFHQIMLDLSNNLGAVRADVEAGQVSDVTITGNEIKGHTVSREAFRTFAPLGYDKLTDTLLAKKVTVNYQPDQTPTWANMLISWAPFLLLIGFWIFFMRQMQSGGNKALSFGKSKAKLLASQQKKVTFKDVAGVDEAKNTTRVVSTADSVQLVCKVLKVQPPGKPARVGFRVPKPKPE